MHDSMQTTLTEYSIIVAHEEIKNAVLFEVNCNDNKCMKK